MGVDARVLFSHQLDLPGIQALPHVLSPARFPHLTALAWNHPRGYHGIHTEPGVWRWIMPEGCTTFAEAWAAERDWNNPLEHYVELQGGSVILSFEEQLADLFTPVRWAMFVVGSDIQTAYQEACRELASVLGSKQCIYLADTIDSHETGMNLDDIAVSLRQQFGMPVASLAALHEGEDVPDRYTVDYSRYYIDHFSDNR